MAKPKAPPASYELILWRHSPRAIGGMKEAERLTATDPKDAARRAIRLIRASEGDVRKVDIVHEGTSFDAALATCGRRPARTEAARDREARLARERRGFHNVIRCEVWSPGFKRALTKKPPRRKKRS